MQKKYDRQEKSSATKRRENEKSLSTFSVHLYDKTNFYKFQYTNCKKYILFLNFFCAVCIKSGTTVKNFH